MQSLESALDALARLVRVLLGSDAVAASKLECVPGLSVLGVDITMCREGFQLRPSPGKVASWIDVLETASETRLLHRGPATKLAGKLSWGCSQLFKRIGRAMLRPIFDQKSKRDGRISAELACALSWWKRILEEGIAEMRPWNMVHTAPVHLFCDAAGRDAHLGAVCFIDGECHWTHMSTPTDILERFRYRQDSQIMGLELLAIALGMSTFGSMIRNRNVVIHSDNTGSEVRTAPCTRGLSVISFFSLIFKVALRRGSARSLDHAQLVHEQWLQAAKLGLQIFVLRVATNDNIADLPSRQVPNVSLFVFLF